MNWIPGQRVLAQTEPELGVGVVLATDGRVVDVGFEAAGMRRRYSVKSAPLRRMILGVGQKAVTRAGRKFIVAAAREEGGLLRYEGDGMSVLESELSDKIPDQGLADRFASGPWSEPRTYDLRCAGWELLSRSLDPDVRGLVGARVSLLPHQLYIAHQVSKRELPRVLLSDEVGLGKTIEAGLIFSSLRALDRATRVLVLAPSALKHQWLSELYRRFNELFSIVDSDGEKEESDLDFVSNQKNISTIEFLLSDERRLQSALEEPWDLLIVDEAHHLGWSPTTPSPAWQLVQALSARSRGLLLLTATPRQQGLETQFGLLHLVDPQRFADFRAFTEESKELRATAQLARRLDEGEASGELLASIRERFKGDQDVLKAAEELKSRGPEHLLKALVDRHGTGRVLMRNRRERLKGFPPRVLHSVPLPAEPADARVEWLGSFLASLGPKEKVLLLCSSPATVRKVDAALRMRTGIKRTLFHEGMDIVERDRQAAWFADPNGAQLLVSSEIGGEGRNFQFASKLVLYDLPPHPDLLEQRIGRLDRIGQKKAVEIYVPWVQGGPEEVYFHWYSRGLKSFERAWNGGAALMESLQSELKDCLEGRLGLETLIEHTQREVEKLEILNRESVDTLVDLNSFDPKQGEFLRKRIDSVDRDPFVREYMEAIFDHYGVEAEDFDEAGTLKLSAHSLTFTESFPELPPGSEILATYDRAQALAREDLKLLNQDHPMVKGVLSMLLDEDEGQVSIAARPKSVKGGRQFEFLFVLQASAPAHLEVERYLPVTLMEVVVDAADRVRLLEQPRDVAAELETVWSPLSDDLRHRAAQACAGALPKLMKESIALAEARAKAVVADALNSARIRMSEEQARLVELRKVNASVRAEEVEEHRRRMKATLEAIATASPRLDALRLVLL